ncbi:MAG TPA: hypothetical protein VEA16_08485 [Vicinamibacterales bacterium]|nr:hypothetical protein [Vicinamibacterales bacterium]
MSKMHRNRFPSMCAAVIACVIQAAPVDARQKFITGVFTGTESGTPIEMIV